ncbi:GNAT family N-acetyltransferase [Streptomyces ipomoeae]|jgi:hypothetical protein|uniref:BioF2-like acetyltransferase domain-containing protein n=2 Tax=Streptomyces ipomoeae TaxID=103232 RepID=L1L4G3_9ACTN|nr:GNAT family N-acetyltransferase [Streptomyces ipomoeae]EKX67498.1 hypothetical protein STRIP9103_07679 [Streptomyces ipomoeae 91-03]MDX2692802.1 GNAT family N-acetyltransferase [Streptomyces ipomoeae]MDX2819611.1 GNAT family N-acetyltransferase [Streptomyces ipomoeae]MDX2838350.1 GNAT family N-acetyltransferase [Streptomyces ipomoeae]MDX2872670.1 GNAT family N-acetyltransferase [Streptomyces ipomoeae]
MTEEPGEWTDVTGEWEALAPAMAGSGPYHTAWWGRAVASVFGGEFRVWRHRDLHVPILSGGRLAARGFASGHVGYGGVLAPDRRVPLAQQLTVVTRLARHLALPCERLVTTPDPAARAGAEPGADTPGLTERATCLITLPADETALWAGYRAGDVRTEVRRAGQGGVTARLLGSDEDLAPLLDLVHRAQRRVGAAYRTPPELIAAIRRRDDESWFGVVAENDGGPVAFGFFLVSAGSCVYLVSGWDGITPNAGALVVHTGLTEAIRRGCRTVDLGYSHQASLMRFKRKFGAELRPYSTWADAGSQETDQEYERDNVAHQ